MPHEPHATDEDNLWISWRQVALGTGSIIFMLGGYWIGDTLTNLRQEIRDIRAVQDARAGVAPRLDTLERRHDDQESRLREVEQRLWQSPR